MDNINHRTTHKELTTFYQRILIMKYILIIMLTFLSAQTFANDCIDGKCIIRSNKPVATITSKVVKPIKTFVCNKGCKNCKCSLRK